MWIVGLLATASLLVVKLNVQARGTRLAPAVTIAEGWHPLFEIKSDPEQSSQLILCGARWDARRNTLEGIVYVSANGGRTWRTALEDTNSPWVSEESCAFGPNHMAYFISEASKVIDGETHHDQGTTRLFVSSDAGSHWVQASQTAWADYSSSAVSLSNGDLVTFYNDVGTHDQARKWGSSVAALVFAADGRKISGPFLDPRMQGMNYQGAFPSNATALKDGSVVALSFSARHTNAGTEYDLGLARTDLSPSPSVRYFPIASMRRCLRIDGNALAYDSKRDELEVAFSADAPTGCQLMLATSSDGGTNWRKSTLLRSPEVTDAGIDHLSMGQGPDGLDGMLWEDSGQWRFALLKDLALDGAPMQLTTRKAQEHVTEDSLMTVIRPVSREESGKDALSTVINVRSQPGVVLRSGGLIVLEGQFLAVLPEVDAEGDSLESVMISSRDAHGISAAAMPSAATDSLRSQIVLLYGGMQSFNDETGRLSLRVKLANRGEEAVHLPIRVEAFDVGSAVAKVDILNADNGLSGCGAIWDVSQVVTGDRLLPGTTTYNSFELQFRVEGARQAIPTYNFLTLRLKVMTGTPGSSSTTCEEQ